MSRSSMYFTVIMLGWASLPAMMAAVELKQDDQSDQVILSNEIVSIAFHMSNGMYTITNIESGQVIIDLEGVAADSWGNADGMRFTWKQEEIRKWVALRDGKIEMLAEDPVGRLVDPGETYLSEDTFYLDVTQPDPFIALETYGLAMRTANNARPNTYDFPTLCGWAVGALSGLGDINNSVALISELAMGQKAGITKYTKVAIRLEPDTYCYHNGNTEQGWWDDAHWSKYGHLVAPYETFARWCTAVHKLDGIPFTYFQVGLPSDDYARAHPGHMLFNDISRLHVKHPHHQPLVTYDYTDPDFRKHVLDTWKRLKNDGMVGIKFDYPETGWRPEGGFENKYATTAFAYREVFRLCREGLGPEAFIHERNLGESGRPMLDVTSGLVDMQRVWGDSNEFEPGMVSKTQQTPRRRSGTNHPGAPG